MSKIEQQLELFPELLPPPKTPFGKLWDFSRWVIEQGPFHGNDLGGDEIEAKAESLGLIREVTYDAFKHGNHEWYIPGDAWWEFDGPLKDG